MVVDPKKKIIIVENSRNFTGAFKAALQEQEILKGVIDFIFVLPKDSTLFDILRQKGIKSYSLPFVEINRSIINLILYLPYLLINSLKLKRIAVKEGADFIQANDFYNLTGAFSKFFGYKGHLITYVRFLPTSRPGPLRKIWVFFAEKFSGAVIAVSDAVLNQLPYSKKKLRIYDPVTCIPPPGNASIHQPLRFLYLSNYIPGKGQNFALEAFAGAFKSGPAMELRFVGGDMQLEKNREYKQRLSERAEELQLGSSVIFDDFFEDVSKVIKESDIVLNFSEAESFSMTCAEASCLGKPVIATRCGGPEEIVQDSYSGILVENRNVDQMKEAMLILSLDEESRKNMGRNGSIYVSSKFNSEKYRLEFQNLINKL
jgi:L-malate glycosyltransferase